MYIFYDLEILFMCIEKKYILQEKRIHCASFLWFQMDFLVPNFGQFFFYLSLTGGNSLINVPSDRRIKLALGHCHRYIYIGP
jgi:hypothetical protein